MYGTSSQEIFGQTFELHSIEESCRHQEETEIGKDWHSEFRSCQEKSTARAPERETTENRLTSDARYIVRAGELGEWRLTVEYTRKEQVEYKQDNELRQKCQAHFCLYALLPLLVYMCVFVHE